MLRPTVERELATSFRRIRFVVRVFDRFDFRPYFRWNELLLELQQTLEEELDYRIEAASLRIFRKHLKRDRIYVPRVFRQLSSRRVLTMEFVEGVFMAEYIRACHEQPARVAQWQTENNVQPEKVARLLYASYLRQLFEDNLFHADLHPGNIILLRDSRVALIDFGSIGFLEGEFLMTYQYFLEAITDRKYGKAVDLIFLISNALPSVDLSDAKNALVLAFRAWETRSRTEELPYDERSLVNAIRDMFVFLMRKRITLAASFLRVFRCELTLDTSLKYLGPELDYMTLTRRFFRRMRGREFERLTEPRAWLDHIGRVTVDAIGASRDWGEDSLYFSTRLRRSLQEFSATTSKAAEFWRSALNLLTLGLGMAAIYLATVFLQIVIGVRIYDTLPDAVRYLPAADAIWLWLALGVGLGAMLHRATWHGASACRKTSPCETAAGSREGRRSVGGGGLNGVRLPRGRQQIQLTQVQLGELARRRKPCEIVSGRVDRLEVRLLDELRHIIRDDTHERRGRLLPNFLHEVVPADNATVEQRRQFGHAERPWRDRPHHRKRVRAQDVGDGGVDENIDRRERRKAAVPRQLHHRAQPDRTPEAVDESRVFADGRAAEDVRSLARDHTHARSCQTGKKALIDPLDLRVSRVPPGVRSRQIMLVAVEVRDGAAGVGHLLHALVEAELDHAKKPVHPFAAELEVRRHVVGGSGTVENGVHVPRQSVVATLGQTEPPCVHRPIRTVSLSRSTADFGS